MRCGCLKVMLPLDLVSRVFCLNISYVINYVTRFCIISFDLLLYLCDDLKMLYVCRDLELHIPLTMSSLPLPPTHEQQQPGPKSASPRLGGAFSGHSPLASAASAPPFLCNQRVVLLLYYSVLQFFGKRILPILHHS